MKINILLLLFTILSFHCIAGDMWEQKANFPSFGRHRAAACSMGNKGYMGFGHINSTVNIAFGDFWEYDPATDSWTQKADFGGGPRYHNLLFSVGNKIYAGLGRTDLPQPADDIWEYNPLNNGWTQLNNYPGGTRIGPVSFVINDVAYVGLGVGSANDNTFYKYVPSADTWIQIADFPGNPRNTGVAFAIDGKGYVGSGNGSFGLGRDFWEYKPSEDQWIQRANIGPDIRQGATGFAVNGRGYILTGSGFSWDNFGDVWEFNPGSNTWTQIEDFPGAARRFMVSFVIHDKAYCATGTTGVNFNDMWRFDPLGTPLDQKKKSIQVNVFPNPSTDYVYFEIPFETLQEHPNLNLNIVDMSGRTIYENIFTDTQVRFDRNQLKNGVYAYQIHAGEEILKSGQLIFQ